MAHSVNFALGTLLPLLFKRTLTLFVLVEPLTMLPVFLASVERMNLPQRQSFAAHVALAVTLALIGAALLGNSVLGFLNIPVAAMQAGGGILMLMLSIAMALGKETVVKGNAPGGSRSAVVPLAVPLLAGPAALSYVITESDWSSWHWVLLGTLPILLVGLSTWLVFRAATRLGPRIDAGVLDLIERLGGFLLLAMAINLMAVGLRGLFPVLAH